MIRHSSRLSLAAITLLSIATPGCAVRRTTPTLTPMVMASVPPNDDATVTTEFRALLDEVIGDSADKVCLSIAMPNGGESDPSNAVIRALNGRTPAHVLTRSACAADERNFGNPRGLLRLRDVTRYDEHTLIVHADAVGDHTARYECMVPDAGPPRQRAHCKILSRD